MEGRALQLKKLKLRPWLRALHRDAGYFVVGLTVIYALSGLAVNHIKDWDPNFTQINRTHHVATPLPEGDDAIADKVLGELKVKEKPDEVYRADDTQLDIVLKERTFHVNTENGTVNEEGQKPRFFLRLANWLHLNRGKKAWSYVADSYAVILLFLAGSGLFMIPGKKGLKGRGAVIALIGAAVPVAYVVLSGGP
ncbi:MAG: PepSY-associated TM helix domain-containing protein [Myxococcales bacterium]|nr:PepSY-associated TM helix domain-containing protein [Myxococcales bacterium]MCB9580680.1 PepSY-associated TM helix domain-containing protein [Polyangiaceae bacterium]